MDTYFRLEHVEIDIYLNLGGDKPGMKICAVNDGEELRETILSDPKDNDQGWVPYFNMHYGEKDWYGAVGATIRVTLIDADSYGILIDNIFP